MKKSHFSQTNLSYTIFVCQSALWVELILIFLEWEKEKREYYFWGKCVGATYKGLLSMRQNTILLFSRHLSRNYGIDIPPTFHFHCWIQFDITIYHYFSLHQSKFFPALFLSTYHQQVWPLKQFFCVYLFINHQSSALIF